MKATLTCPYGCDDTDLLCRNQDPPFDSSVMPFNTGDIVIVEGKKLTVSGTQHYGEYVVFRDKTHASAKAKEITMYRHGDGWIRVV